MGMYRRLLALALVCVPLLASAQGVKYRPGWRMGSNGSSTVLSAPLSSNGPLLSEDAGTVAHVYWNGSALVDSKGNAWTQNGTVPQVAAGSSPFVPGKAGAGPYSAANYYTKTTDLNPTQSWWACWVFSTSDITTDQYAVGDYNGSAGWAFRLTGSTARLIAFYATTGFMQSIPANAPVANGINVLCGGWSSVNAKQYAKLNLGTMIASAVVGAATSSPAATRIGYPLGSSPFLGTSYEFIFNYGEPSDALFTSVQKAVWGQGALTVSRALDTHSYVANGSTWLAPAGTLVTESAGASIWKAATNSVLNSGTHPKIAEATAALSTGAYVGWHAGTGTMTIAAGTATVTGLSCTAVSPGTLCPFTVTVAGTMAVTTSAGTVTQAQIEPGAYATSYIPTAAAAVTRNATVATTTTSSGIGNKGCVAVTGTPGGNRAWNTATVELLAQGTAGAANYWDLSVVSGAAVFAYRDGSNVAETCTGGSGLSAGAHRIHACLNNQAISMWVDGVSYACTTSGSAGLRTAEPATVYIGQDSGGSYFDGNVKGAKICARATRPGDCP